MKLLKIKARDWVKKYIDEIKFYTLLSMLVAWATWLVS